MPKYHIITFGCQMNKADSERIAASLEKKKYQPASHINEADLIIVNMCSVRQSAVDRVFGLAPKFKKLKAKKILTGCILNQDKGKLEEIFDKIWRRPPKSTALSKFIPISYGCNHSCAYCVVPQTRGRLVCRPPQEIVQEVKKAVENGVKQIWLLGQNVNDYSPLPFARLLKKINALPGDFQIRFTSPHPMNFSDELIQVMAESKKVAKYLNLPVQSGDDEILKKMNRPYTVKQYQALVKKIRKRIPDLNLSTDVIVGFPGETKKQFENTVKLFKEIKFNMAYIAKYSPRPGTAAFRMKDTVPLSEKKRREKYLKSLLVR